MKNYRTILLSFILIALTACTPAATPASPVVPTQAAVIPQATATLLPADTAVPALPLSVTPTWTVTDNGVKWAQIDFVSLTPQGITLQECWNGAGMDDKGRVYIGFTSKRNDGRGDFVVFRYDPSSAEKLYLGSFLDIAQSANNLLDGESIPKGHTRMIFAEGKMYMASQGFHDLKQEIDSLPSYRGSHLFAYDTNEGTWQDLAKELPDGVVTQHEGIISLNIIPNMHLLVGLAHPSSNIVLYDYSTNKLVKVVPGIPWTLGNPLSREIIVTPSGHIYTYRGTEEAEKRAQSHNVWKYDIQTDEMTDTGVTMTNGFWNNQTQTRDGSKIYISTVNGQLYEFDVATETFKDLGYELPKTDKRSISYVYTVQLSPDEQIIYYVISVIGNGMDSGSGGGFDELYAYHVASGEITFVQQMIPGIYTSADLRDNENIYFAHFGGLDNFWSGKPRLMIIQDPKVP